MLNEVLLVALPCRYQKQIKLRGIWEGSGSKELLKQLGGARPQLGLLAETGAGRGLGSLNFGP
jgi:hypothetical protein